MPSSRTMNRILLTTNGHFRPYRSAARPKMIEPTERNIRTNVIPHDICTLVLSKVSARSDKVKLTVKKSKASQDFLNVSGWNLLEVDKTYPSKKTNEEEKPLFSRQHSKELEWVRGLIHGRLESRDTGRSILCNCHLVWLVGLDRSIMPSGGADDFLFAVLVCHGGWFLLPFHICQHA